MKLVRESLSKHRRAKMRMELTEREEMEKELRDARVMPLVAPMDPALAPDIAEVCAGVAADAAMRAMSSMTIAPREPSTPAQRKLQLGEGPKPTTLGADCTYAEYVHNKRLLKSLMRNAIIPEGYKPEDFQACFFDYLSPAMITLMGQKIAKELESGWEKCIKFLGIIMDRKHPKWGRRIQAFTLVPN